MLVKGYQQLARSENAGSNEQKEGCCKPKIVRRLVRVFYLYIIIAVTIIVPIIVINYMHTSKSIQISTDMPIQFNLRDCKIYISEDSSLPLFQTKISIDMPGRDYDYTGGNTHTIKALNSKPFFELCLIDMTINPQAILSGLQLACTGTCVLLHQGPSKLNLGTNSLIISGDTVNFLSVKMSASQVQANVKKGNLHIYNLELNGGQTSTLSTIDGDVVVQSLNSMKVIWTQVSNNFCFSAPKVMDASAVSVSGCNSAKGTSIHKLSCVNAYNLCSSNDAGNCGQVNPAMNLYLTSGQGNVYANVISSDGAQPIDNDDIKGFNYTNGIQFSENLNLTINSLQEKLTDTSKADPVIWMGIGNVKTYSSVGHYYVIMGNPAYLDATPWWMSFFSGSLLIGERYEVEGNFAPGICPFRTSSKIEDLSAQKGKFLDSLTSPSGKTEVALAYSPDFTTITNELSVNTGFTGIKGSLILYGIGFADGRYYLSEHGLGKRAALLMAVIISVILAFLIGVLALYILLIALQKLIIHYSKQDAHTKEYSKRVGKMQEDSVEKGSKVADSAEAAKKKLLLKQKEDEELKFTLIYYVFSKIPSQYMLIDLAVSELKKYVTSSLEEFFEMFFELKNASEVDDYTPILLSSIKETYEQYCFLRQMPEEDLLSSKSAKMLKFKGFLVDKQGKETVILTKIRWKENASLKIDEKDKSEESLTLFLDRICDKTPFEGDVIELEKFEQKYMEFCDINRLGVKPVTINVLSDAHQIPSVTEKLYYLFRNKEGRTEGDFFMPNLDKARKLNKQLVSDYNDKEKKEKGIELVSTEHKSKSDEDEDEEEQKASYNFQRGKLSKGFLLFDFIAVVIHLTCLGALIALPIVITLFVQLEISDYAISDFKYYFHFEDLQYAPWNLYYKIGTLSSITIAIWIIAGIYALIGVIDLTVYYRYMTFTVDSFTAAQRKSLTLLSRILQGIEWVYICIIISLGVMYAALVGVWSILGAILNPNAYLAYGAAVMTFVTFATAKYNELTKVYAMGIDALQTMLFSRLQGLLEDIMKKILKHTGMGGEIIKAAIENPQSLIDRAQSVMQETSVGKMIMSSGLNPKNIIGCLQGDENAIADICVKQGMPKDVIMLIIAVIKNNPKDLVEGITKLAKLPQFQIPEDVVVLGVDLMKGMSEQNIPNLISKLATTAFNIISKEVMKKIAEPEYEAYIDVCKQVFPMFTTAIINMKAEDFEKFLENYEEINEFLLHTVQKKLSSLGTGDLKIFSKFFTADGEPLFALPPYIVKGIRVFNMIALGNQEHSSKAIVHKTLEAVFYLMQNFLGVDKKIINMLNMLISAAPEQLQSIDLEEGSLSQEDQYAILTDAGEILGIPPAILNFVWTIWTGDQNFDDKFVKSFKDFCKTILGIDLPEYMIKLALKIFTVMNGTFSTNSLIQAASAFGVEPKLSSIVQLLGSRKLGPEQIAGLIENPLFIGFAEKMCITPTEVMGVASLLKGTLNFNVIQLFKSLQSRWGLTGIPTPKLVSLLTLFMSQDEGDLSHVAKTLNLEPLEFIFIAKKVLHPGNVPNEVFERLGLNIEDPNIKFRHLLNFDNEKQWNDWIDSIIRLLSAEYKIGLKEGGGFFSSIASGVMEKKKENPMLGVGGAGQGSKMSTTKMGVPFSEIEKQARNAAKLIINIQTTKISPDIVQQILSYAKLDCEKEKIDKVADIMSTIMSSLQELLKGSSENRELKAMKDIAEVMQINEKMFKAFANIVLVHRKKNLKEGLKKLIKGVLTSHEEGEMIEYLDFVSTKCKVKDVLDKSLTWVANQLHLPSFFVKTILGSINGDVEIPKLTLEEAMLVLNYAGLHEQALKAKGIFFEYANKKVSLQEIRLLIAGIAAGHMPMLSKALDIIGLPKVAQKIVEAIAIRMDRERLSILAEILPELMNGWGVPPDVVYILLEIWKYLCGLGGMDTVAKGVGRITGYEYLKKKLGILPQALKCLEGVFRENPSQLIEDLPLLLKEMSDMDRLKEHLKIPHEIIGAILTLITGKGVSMEFMASQMGVNLELIELCMKLTSITKGDLNDIGKRIASFLQAPLIRRVWKVLNIDPDRIAPLLYMSFAGFEADAVSDLMRGLNIVQHIDMGCTKFLSAMAMSWASLQTLGNYKLERDSEARMIPLEFLQAALYPVAKKFKLDPELALIGVRLRQGDFFILEDKRDYLEILLPNDNCRKVAMGMCGTFTLPIQFKHTLGDYPAKFKPHLTFEGSCELLCSMFKINPIVARLANFDNETLDYIQKHFGYSKQMMSWLIITLINLPIFMLEGISLREYKRALILKRMQAEEFLKTMESEEQKKQAEKEVKEEKKLATEWNGTTPAQPPPAVIPPAQPKADTPITLPGENQPPPAKLEAPPTADGPAPPKTDSLTGSIAGAPNAAAPNAGAPNAGAPNAAAPDAGAPNAGAPNAGVPPALALAPPGAAPENKEEEKKKMDQKKFFRSIGLGMLKKAGQVDANLDFFDRIDFNSEVYNDPNSKLYSHESLSPETELMEVLIFNTEKYARMDYDYLFEKNRRSGSFNVSDDRVEELLGTKQEYNQAMAKAFFANPEDPAIWANKETLNFNLNWCTQADRSKRLNAWEVIKKMLKKLSDDPNITNGATHKYDKITLGHLILFMLLMRIRDRMASTDDLKRDDRFYSLFAVELEMLGVLFEGLSMIKCNLGTEYSRIRFYKIISLALNVNIINAIDHRIVPSLYCQEAYFPMKDKYENKEDVQKTIDYCNKFNTQIVMNTDLKFLNYLSMSEYTTFLEKPYDILDCLTVAKQNCPYNADTMTANVINGQEIAYDPSGDDPFMESVPKENINKRKWYCIRAKELVNAKIQNVTEDVYTQKPITEVTKFLDNIEILFTIEYEKMDFLLDMARFNWSSFKKDYVKDVFVACSFIKNETSMQIYKALCEMIYFKKVISEWRYERITEGNEDFRSDIITNLISFLPAKLNMEKGAFDLSIMEDIILLSHGVINLTTLKNLAGKLNLEPELVKTFFLAGFPKEILNNKEEMKEIIKPLIEKMRLNEKQEALIHSIISIFYGNIDGWKDIIKYCCFAKKNATMIFEMIINCFNWEDKKKGTHSPKGKISEAIASNVPKKIEVRSLLSKVVKDFPEKIKQIIPFLMENEAGVLSTIKESQLGNILSFIHMASLKNVPQALEQLGQLLSLIGIKDDKTFDMLKTMTILISKHKIQNPEERKQLILLASNTLTTWVFSLLKFDKDETREEYLTLIKSLTKILLGILYGEFDLMKTAITTFNPVMESLTRMWTYIREVKNKISEYQVSLKDLNDESLSIFIEIIGDLVILCKRLSDIIFNLNNNIEKEKEDARSLSLPLERFAKFEENLGNTWKALNSFTNEIQTVVKKYMDKKYDPKGISIVDDLDMVEGEARSKKLMAAFDKAAKAAMEVAGFDISQYKILILLMLGDPMLLIDGLEQTSLPKEILGVVKMVMKVIEQNEETFKKMAANPADLKNYESLITQHLAGPMVKYIKTFIDERLKGKTSGVEAIMLKKASELLSKPETLVQFLMLLHYIKYRTIKKENVVTIMKFLFGILKESLPGQIKEFFPRFISALSGFADLQKDDKMLSYGERRTVFIRAFVELCLPSLVPKLNLIEQLIKLSLDIAKVNGNKELLKMNLAKFAEELGSLLGINQKMFSGLLGLLDGDIDSIIDFVAPLVKLNPDLVKKVMKMFKGASKSVANAMKSASNEGKKIIDEAKSSRLETLNKKVQDGNASVRELFELIDLEGDNSGAISTDEFSSLMKKLNMPMTQHRIAEVFARCKSKHSNKPDELDFAEFDEAVKYVQSKRISEGMNILGLSTNQLIFIFVMLVIILILLFVFIFLGIAAFALGGTFGSIINSMLPVGAGIGVGKGGLIDFSDTRWQKKLKEAAEQVIHMIGG